ncbi:DarT ssDNA thymidine ADP-ribosyltransferase family protein [Psychrobacter faecalis]|uniref:DarT ssDNA thymidine ADP-ribosyltransferase family protein n=1 Tax=Psychrobacter faecalis TaxID=180588 RepID=A0ABT9HGL7_9GAMM|nr:DarT ssDNA thymidine ADP-ribosyltransferase family protein [Psychrobacter faecalis]MDP4544906.1 DarT ssDNA thymidine ADP-ribosyltransferase family protein [Psychrobacter faecalis]
MEIFLIIIVFIVVWFFTSTSKSEDVRSAIRFAKEAKDGTSKFLDELNDNLDDFNKDFEERTEKYIIESKRNILKKQKEHLVWLSELDDIDDINKSIKSMGLDGIDEDVTSIVDDFKEAGRYEEISHLVIKRSNDKSGFFSTNTESYVPNYDFGRQKRDRATKEKLAKEKLTKEKLAKEKLTKEKLAKDKLAKDKLVKEKLVKALDDTTSLEDISKYAGEVDSYLIDFLKIRFYLSGKTSYPDLRCVDQYFKSKFSDLDKSSYGSIWQNIVSATVFDSSKCKNIDAIYHFTHKSNLSSILEYGILTRTNLNNKNLRYAFNDQMRLDGVLDSISLSFSHPNFKMFYKYRKQTSDDDWVVLKISPSLIYGKEQQMSNRIEDLNYLNKAVFCNTNAASNKMRNLSIEERMTCNAFLDMFESPIGRALPTYTYDNQAEILYLGNIPVDFIEEIYTNHQNESLNWVRELGYKVTENDIVFDQRRYRDG